MTDPRAPTAAPGRPAGRPAPPRRPRPGVRAVPLPVAALTTTVWAAVVTAAPVVAVALVVWVADRRSATPALDAVRLALDGWLLAHGVPLHTPAGRVGLAPLLVTALVLRQLYRAGSRSARATGAASPLAALRTGLAAGVVYGALAAGVALVSTAAGVHASPVVAAGLAGFLAAGAATVGALRVRGIGTAMWARLPVAVRTGLTAGAAAALALSGAGALAAGLRLVAAWTQVRDVAAAYPSGFVGTVALFGLCALYAPTAAVWAVSYLVGPGFALGTGTSVTAGDVVLGPLPAVPLLAAVPPGPAGTGWSLLVLAAPLLAGVVAGLVVTRRPRTARRMSWRVTAGAALLAGPVAGALLGVAALAAGGPLGGGRLAAVGPSAWRVALVAAAEIGGAALVAAVGARAVGTLRARPRVPLGGPAPADDALPAGDGAPFPPDHRTGDGEGRRATGRAGGGAGPAARPDPAARPAAPTGDGERTRETDRG